MIIQSSNLRFASTHARQEQEETLTQASLGSHTTRGGTPVRLDTQFISRENVLLNASQSSYLYSRSQVSRADQPDSVQVHSREEMLQSVVAHAFSREVQIRSTTALRNAAGSGRLSPQGQPMTTQASVQFGHAYRYQQEQHSTLTIEGQVHLADNRTLDFMLHTRFDSSLQFQSASGQFAQMAVRTDPLILNLHGGTAQLTDTAFDFDLDGDGQREAVSFATGGSGFIAFDRNGDGRINDGSELFGTRSGDGFADLAALDEDGNGFLDSQDTGFAHLQFLTRSEDGHDTLQSLHDLGVAAIALDSAETPALLRGSTGQEIASVRRTGVFILESGAVGTVQQVDLTQRDRAEEAALQADFANPQVIETAAPDPEQQALDQVLQRLEALRADFQARREADTAPGGEDSKTLLERLVDQLEAFVAKQDEARAERRAAEQASRPD